MTNEFKNILYSSQISNMLQKFNWEINLDPKKNYHSYYFGEIADYYLNITSNDNKICFEFTLDIEIPKIILDDILKYINFVNQKSEEGFFVFDLNVKKIKYKIIRCFCSEIDKNNFQNYLRINLYLTNLLFHNFISGVHNLIYGEKIEDIFLDLLFLNAEGNA